METTQENIKYTESARKAEKNGKPIFKCKCKQCGSEFYSAREWAEICSDECKKEYYKVPVWQRQQMLELEKKPTPVQQEDVSGQQEVEPEQEVEQYPTPRKYNPNRRIYIRQCCVCGQDFKTNNRHSIYCSVTCQQRKWKDDHRSEMQNMVDALSMRVATNRPLFKLEYEYIERGKEKAQLEKEIEELKQQLADKQEVIDKQKTKIKELRAKE